MAGAGGGGGGVRGARETVFFFTKNPNLIPFLFWGAWVGGGGS